MPWNGGPPLTDNASQSHWNTVFLPADRGIIEGGGGGREKSVATEKSLFWNDSNTALYCLTLQPKHYFGHPYNLVG